MRELDIASAQVNLACFLDDPLIDRTQLASGMDVVFLHFQTGISYGQICAAVITLLGQRLCLGNFCTFHEVPAVCSLID